MNSCIQRREGAAGKALVAWVAMAAGAGSQNQAGRKNATPSRPRPIDLHLPTDAAALEAIGGALLHFGETLHGLFQVVHELRLATTELTRQQERTCEAEADARQRAEQLAERRRQAEEAQVRLTTLRESIGAQVDELQRRLREARTAVSDGERHVKAESEALRTAGEARARGEQKVLDADTTLQERAATRQHAITQLQGFAATGLLSAALPEAELPDLRAPWTIEPALTLARRTEQALAQVADDDEAWTRIQSQISHDYGELGRALTALGQQAQADTSDYGMVVSVIYQNRPERPDQLTARLDAEIDRAPAGPTQDSQRGRPRQGICRCRRRGESPCGGRGSTG